MNYCSCTAISQRYAEQNSAKLCEAAFLYLCGIIKGKQQLKV